MAAAEETTGGLTGSERHRLALLGLPTFGLALSITVVSTYVPTVARRFTGSTTTIGVVIGAEGIGALALPVLVGAVMVGGSIALFAWLVVRDGVPKQERTSVRARDSAEQMAELLRDDPPLRAFFFANALLELALGALKTFVILWLVRGLGVK